MEASSRNLYAQVGLSQIPHILSLVDRNLLSPTYGCFDRSYWHYKTAAFPSGMYQEFVLPLALVYGHAFPGGEAYSGQPRLRELAIAGIRYAARSSHMDGSCDDYFPYERALGAVAFSLYACTESYLLLELDQGDMLAFFNKRGQWLMNRRESGKLSNHHALVVLALYNLYEITNNPTYLDGVHRRLDMLLAWQTAEGWFPEYEGCDPGYLTATIDFLAKYYKKSNDNKILEPIKSAASFASHFMHPDGSYGGEYGSRNTALFFPHGFELLAGTVPCAAQTADLYMEGIRKDHRIHLEDDRLCAHLTYNHLQAFLDYWEGERGKPIARAPERRYWKMAKLYHYQDERRYAVVAASKGGAFRLYLDGKLAAADSGLIARLADGTTLVTHLVDDYSVNVLDDGILVEGRFSRCRYRLPTSLTQAIFHLGMLLAGRWGSDLVRTLLQHLLIVGKRPAAMQFRRTITFNQRVVLVDEIWHRKGPKPSKRVVSLYAGTDHTSIYVAVSHSYQRACLHPWTDYGAYLDSLHEEGFARIERFIG